MTNLYRTRVVLTGWEGAPGLNTFMWSQGTLPEVTPADVSAWHQDIADAYVAARDYLANGITFQVQADVDVIDEETGNVIGIVIAEDGAVGDSATPSAGSALSRATQAIVAAQSDVWQNGRRLAGRIFFGPLGEAAFGSDGLLTTTAAGDIGGAFGNLNTGTGPRWAIYSRPKPGQVGYYGDVVNVTCRRSPGVLRSRRPSTT